MPPKIFVIGLPKTGTTSLMIALNSLGLRVMHNPSDAQTMSQLRAGDCQLAILDKLDGISDLPAACFYQDFDVLYPGSKFILTLRDIPSWLVSSRRWEERVIQDVAMQDRKANGSVSFYYTAMFGCWKFHPGRYTRVYRRHVDQVKRYFAGSSDLLVMDVCGGDGWEKLCPFLGRPVPDRPFPHANKSPI
jgi:hypothetical protein